MNIFRNIFNVGLAATIIAAGTMQAVLKHPSLYDVAIMASVPAVFAVGMAGIHNDAQDVTLTGLNTFGYYARKRIVRNTNGGEISGIRLSKPGRGEVAFGAANYALRKATHFVDEQCNIEKTVSGWFDGSWTPEMFKNRYGHYAKSLAVFLAKEGAYDVLSDIIVETIAGDKTK